MRILHITTYDNDGAGMCCMRIHRSLLDSGIDSKVLVMKNTMHNKEEYEYGYLKNRISKIPSKLLRMLGLGITSRNKIMKLSKQNNRATYSLPISSINLLNNKLIAWADIIHLHWVCNYLDYPSFFKSTKKPVIWTLHDEYFFHGIAHYSNQVLRNNEMELKYYQIKRKSLRNIEKLGVVLLSSFFLKKFKDHEFLVNRDVRIINNSIDTNVFKPISIDRKIMRRCFGLSEEDTVFAFTAMDISSERKGLDILSKAIKKIGNGKMKVLAIGNNFGNASWPNVIEAGPLFKAEDICKILSIADYFAMPSLQEAFAQSPMEAMACGLPVVAFPVSGMSELVNIQNGVVCEDFTIDALQKGIIELLSRRYESSIIRQDMINRFSPEAIAHKYISFYQDLLNS